VNYGQQIDHGSNRPQNQLKGPEEATIDTPPNHKLFDTKKVSPVLQQRKAALDAQNAAALSSSNSGIGNISIADLVALVRPPAPAMPPYPYMQQPPPLPPLPATSTSDMLLPPSLSIGPSMPLAAFCVKYNITEVVRTKLDDEGYTDAHLLQYVSIAELKEAGFKNGEIASLRYAVSKWSVPAVPV
jgi:hypothetical protein